MLKKPTFPESKFKIIFLKKVSKRDEAGVEEHARNKLNSAGWALTDR